MATSEAMRRCPDLALVSGEDLSPYRAASRALAAALAPLGPAQRLGLDELWVDPRAGARPAGVGERGGLVPRVRGRRRRGPRAARAGARPGGQAGGGRGGERTATLTVKWRVRGGGWARRAASCAMPPAALAPAAGGERAAALAAAAGELCLGAPSAGAIRPDPDQPGGAPNVFPAGGLRSLVLQPLTQ